MIYEPCIYCKSTKVQLGQHPRHERYSIRCNNCYARGPACGTSAHAMEAWNYTSRSYRVAIAKEENEA